MSHADFVKRLIEMGHLNYPASTQVDRSVALAAFECAIELDHEEDR